MVGNIRDLVDETIDQALQLAKGSSGYYLQSLIEEDLLEGTNFRKELNDEIAYKVTREDERTLVNNLREVKHTITEALAAKVKDKIDEDLAAPLRAWASK
ncbi:hypothetical protein D6D01_06640 [Aureobasidium pullulans]|uniref:Uncharacterized protein n=1 Tax=Aureobasidium pullulans TaxID=5580 RepID=A0A4S9KW20_AURPU|nr:hypothetical protein D6D01_06640 [Aureobasidium pullulans]